MKNLTDEIKLTLELMQGDIDDSAHGELQSHLYSLLEMKRERLGERAHTDMPDQIQVWPADADERIDVIGQNGNDGEHYRDAMIGKRAGGGIIIGFEGDDAIIMCDTTFGSMSWGDAVQFCEAFFLDEHSDWRLPTKDQLNLAWVNREKLYDLNLDDYLYWSSTQYSAYSANLAWVQSGDIVMTSKRFRVRPVRSVKIENLEFEGSDITGEV